MLQAIKKYFHDRNRSREFGEVRTAFAQGKMLSRFIAMDLQREVKVVNVDELDAGFVTVQIRTTNVMYLARGLADRQPFSKPERIPVESLWHWTGQPWGGLPDGTSIVGHLESKPDDE